MANIPMTRTTGTPGVVAGVGWGGGLKTVSASIDWTSALPAGTQLIGPALQAGSIILDVMLVCSAFGNTVNIFAGPTLAGDRFINAATTTGGVVRSQTPNARPYVMPQNGNIIVGLTNAATTATGSIDVTVFYQPPNT